MPDAFLFDFDGTLTAAELLPRIAAEVGLEEEIGRLTAATVAGEVGFEASLRARVDLLAGVTPEVVSGVLDALPVRAALLEWIAARRDRCWVVTGNLDCWVGPWMARHGLRCFASRAAWVGGRVRVEQVLADKTDVLAQFAGRRTVMVGDGANDASLVAAADVGIAVAFDGAGRAPTALVQAADVVVGDEGALLRALDRVS